MGAVTQARLEDHRSSSDSYNSLAQANKALVLCRGAVYWPVVGPWALPQAVPRQRIVCFLPC